MRFHERNKKRDHRKLSLLVETGQCREKFIYQWRLDKSTVGDVTAARKVLPCMPCDTRSVAMDGAYDARPVYALVEENGVRPIVKERINARRKDLDARGRAIRWKDANPSAWKAEYDRRPIVESVNSSLKRRFGDRLWARGVWNQRREMAFRVLVYNCAMKTKWSVRVRIQRGEM